MKRIICPKCEYVGLMAKKKRGSPKVELFGWAVFPLGLPYSIWRMFGKTPVCKACGHSPVINEDSIVGQHLLEKIYKLPPESEPIKPIKKPSPIITPEKPLEITPQKRDKSIRRPEDDKDQF